MSAPVIGIDLGTTNTVVAAVRTGRASALSADNGEVLIPSVVSFHPSGSVLVGSDAKARRKIDSKNTIYSVKRLIGRSWDSDEVQLARKRFPFEMREGPGQAALVVARKETYTLPEISAFVLRKAKNLAEAALGASVERAVITVPANFNDLQRAATKVAGRVAGLEVMRILNEPTAAALAYGYGKASSERLLVYDFGGGTLDITLLDLSDNVFEVLATAGDTFLGGDDIDHAISDRMAEQLLTTHRIDAKADPGMLEQLRAGAEDIKKQLTDKPLASVTLVEIAHHVGGRALDFSFSMTRSELEGLITPIVAKTFDVCREALEIARLGAQDFSQVLLVGGSTRIPLVRSEVERFFKLTPVTTLNPDEVVAVGAAIQANALSGAEKRRSALPPPPKPVARTRLSSHPDARARQPSVPASTETAPIDTASYGRPTRKTAPGLQPAASAARASATRAPRRPIAPLVVPPATGQPLSRVPMTADRAGRTKRTTATGLGGVTAPPPELDFQPTPAAPSRAPRGTSGDFLDTSELEELPDAELADFDDDEEITRARDQPVTPAQREPALLGDLDEEPTQSILRDSLPGTTGLDEPAAPTLGGAPAVPAPPALPARGLAPAATLPLTSLPNPTELWGNLGTSPPALPLPTPEIPEGGPAAPAGPLRERLDPGLPSPTTLPLPTTSGAMDLSTRSEPPLLIDVTPLTLSVETVGGYCDTVIERNSPIPCEKSRQFATVMDNQDSVRVRVSQGERALFAQNTLLGEVLLSGLRAAPRGGVTIEVQFALDASGMLNVHATDVGTGHSVSTRIRLVGLSDLAQVDSLRLRHAALPLR